MILCEKNWRLILKLKGENNYNFSYNGFDVINSIPPPSSGIIFFLFGAHNNPLPREQTEKRRKKKIKDFDFLHNTTSLTTKKHTAHTTHTHTH